MNRLMLTECQLAAVALLADGHSNKVIAHRLRIQETAVKSRLCESMKRLGFSNRVQLAVWYVKQDMEEEVVEVVYSPKAYDRMRSAL